jgi:hypothetical protein
MMQYQCRAAAFVAAVCAVAFVHAAHAQAAVAPSSGDAKTPPLFASEAPLALTFTANLERLRDDRDPKSPYRHATITYVGDDGKTVVVPLRVKTHGIWRLKHCEFPPLRLNFSNKETKHTLFYDLQKPKFTNSCRDNDTYERYVLQEAQLYRIYQRLTPVSHRVRVVRVTYADSATGKTQATRYGFIIEDPDELADRAGGQMVKTKGAGPGDLDEQQAAIAYLFEYMIGNTDFSFNGLHNSELIGKTDGSALLPVAYDFDFSGAVNASYATVDPKLPVKRVRDRLYRGYCVLAPSQPAAIALFNERKDAIYALYRDDVGKLLDEKVARETLSYFDDFYAAIKNAKDADRYLFDSCVGRH